MIEKPRSFLLQCGAKSPAPHPPIHTFKGQERSRQLGMFISKRKWDQEIRHIRIMRGFSNQCILPHFLSNRPTQHDQPSWFVSLIPESPSVPSTQVWLVNLPTTHSDVSHQQGAPLKSLRVRGSLQLLAVGRSLIKGLLEWGRQKHAHVMEAPHPSDTVFIFRSGSVNNNWMHVYNFVEGVLRKFDKYGFFALEGVFLFQEE